MKKKLVNIIHGIFRIGPFEKMLLALVRNKYVDEPMVKLIPPNASYPPHTTRSVKTKGLELFADLHDYNDWKAYWELREVEREALYDLAKSAITVVDVGVNNGWVLMNLAKIVGANNGFVFGFEPHPGTYRRCLSNIEASGIKNCKVFNTGCASKATEMVMKVETKSNSGRNRIVNSDETSFNNDLIKVKLATMDEQLPADKKIDLIKVDVEGFEFEVLKGAHRTLSESRPIVFMETDDLLLRKNNTSPAELLVFLRDKYNYRFLHAATRQEIDVSDDFSRSHFDVICLPGDAE